MAWPYKYESGVTHYDKDKAFPGYTIYVTVPGRSGAEPHEIPGEVQLL